MSDKIKKYRFLHSAKCPFCKQTNLIYIDFSKYEDFTERDEEKWSEFCDKEMDTTLPLNPCEHLAIYADAYNWMTDNPVIPEKWQPQILKLAKNLNFESNISLSDTSKLNKFMGEYLEENCYNLELEELMTKLFPEYKHKIVTIETNWENGPSVDYSADPFLFFIFLNPNNK